MLTLKLLNVINFSVNKDLYIYKYNVIIKYKNYEQK